MESNISFSSNVDIIQSTSQRTGDPLFLKKITDYDALMKLRRISNGSMNSKFHIFSSKQIEIISPEFRYCGYYVERNEYRMGIDDCSQSPCSNYNLVFVIEHQPRLLVFLVQPN